MAAAAPAAAWSTRRALDEMTRHSVRLAAGWLTALLAVFTLADPWINPPPHHIPITIADALLTCAFLAAFLAFRRDKVEARWANAVGASVAILNTLDILFDMMLLRDPQQTVYLMLVVVGAGCILLSLRWMLAVAAVTFGGWAAVALAIPEQAWSTLAMAMFASCVLAVVIHVVRIETYSRMERLRQAEAQRSEELEVREEALQGLVAALQESEDRYRSLVEQAPDAFLVISQGKVLYANGAGLRLFGARSMDQLVGRDAASLVHPDDRDLVLARNRQVEHEARRTEFVEVRILTLDGRVVQVETLGQPILYMGRPADQTIVRDITDRKRAEAERMAAMRHLAEIERLKEMDRMKTQFVNAVSHELRTPLTPVKVQLHILKKGVPPPDAYARSINVLERNFHRLNALVDELLEVARIQAGTLRVARKRLDLQSVVQDALVSYADVAKHGGIELTARVEPDLLVDGDARRLTQVMDNLLGNAFKFTPAGGAVRVEARREGASAVVRVADTGPGLSEEEIARLFEPFSQVHDTMEKTHAGTGLGLYICRGIVEGHDGAIWCESAGKGRGSTFAFRIPLHAQNGGAAPAAAAARDLN